MVKVKIISPTVAYLDFGPGDFEKIQSLIKYKNTSNDFAYRKHVKNKYWKASNPEAWQTRGDELKSKINLSLLFEEDGRTCIRPGYLPYLENVVELQIDNQIVYPEPKLYPWYKKLEVTPYDYQKLSVENLIKEKHGNVSLCTGSGKSLILLMIAQKLGLKTVITTPSISIFNELLEKFEHHFGKSAVGALGGGKKRLGKKFTVCVADSVENLKPGTKEYEDIYSSQVLLTDESHTFGSETLNKMCHGVLRNIPYRFFVSGTQTRGDGTEKLLHSIIGRTVAELTTKDAIEGGYVCDHEFRIVKMLSSNPGFNSADALAMKRSHFLKNSNIAQFIAKLSESTYQARGHQTLVLVDELSQISLLLPMLRVPASIATSTTDVASIIALMFDADKDKVKAKIKSDPEKYPQYFIDNMTPEQRQTFEAIKNSDPQQAVEDFNNGKTRVLIGTSCIATGTNIFPTHNTVNWSGGTSEIKTKQGAVGRSVRKLENSKYVDLHAPKPKSIIWDFDIVEVEPMERHLAQRISFYEESGVPIIRL
mgnify:CR=1 FL=1